MLWCFLWTFFINFWLSIAAFWSSAIIPFFEKFGVRYCNWNHIFKICFWDWKQIMGSISLIYTEFGTSKSVNKSKCWSLLLWLKLTLTSLAQLGQSSEKLSLPQFHLKKFRIHSLEILFCFCFCFVGWFIVSSWFDNRLRIICCFSI